MPLRTILLHVEFDGTAFHGWQYQDNARSVQGELRLALEKMTGERINLRASSRTDAGVHARALPVTFTVDSTIPRHGFQRGLNTLLPRDVSIALVRDMPEGFDARDSSTGKRYLYDIWNGEGRSALRRFRSWWVKGRPLDLAGMQRAASHMIGEHDFASFRSVNCDSKTTFRRMKRIDISEMEPGLLRITVEGNAFLQHMVRIITGTLVEVGARRMQADEIPNVLAARNRSAAGQTAPARGLILDEVFFDGVAEAPKRGDRK